MGPASGGRAARESRTARYRLLHAATFVGDADSGWTSARPIDSLATRHRRRSSVPLLIASRPARSRTICRYPFVHSPPPPFGALHAPDVDALLAPAYAAF